jgi:ElaB/YqjD/DUF883 family membrane-anchored ribosome-binding protein
MAKLVKFALLGGIAGVGIAVYRSSQAPTDQSDDLAGDAVKTGASLAAAGAALGFLADRRSRRKNRKTLAFEALKSGSLMEAARIARPAVEHALEIARERAKDAAKEARPHVEHAAEVARDRAKDAADAARPRIKKVSKRARKRAEKASKDARKRAEAAGKDARKRAGKAGQLAKERATEVVGQAKERIEERQPILVTVA